MLLVVQLNGFDLYLSLRLAWLTNDLPALSMQRQPSARHNIATSHAYSRKYCIS